MKLAEALILRADHQKRLAQLKQRLLRNAKVQEGETPGEDPKALLREFETVATELEQLIQRVNRTNVQARIASGVTITEALAARDVLRLKADMYRELAQAATITQDRYTRSEVKFISTVDVSAVQKEADHLSKQHRELDAQIQAANWQTELMD
jgi:N-methylhydantoinase B/oxoprolinase/acetone carboxylase alpha subunit